MVWATFARWGRTGRRTRRRAARRNLRRGFGVASQPGEGTSCEVFLPPADKRPTKKADPAFQAHQGSETILFADDDPAIAKLAKTSLELLGYKVELAPDGLQALHIFSAKPAKFDLLITDETMPRLRGERLAIEARRIRPELPIVLCTGHSETVNPESAQKPGIDALLYKPIKPREIGRVIRQILDGTPGPAAAGMLPPHPPPEKTRNQE